MPIDRRTTLKLAASAALFSPMIKRASAAERQVHIGIYNSNLGQVVSKEIIPGFEKDYKCRVFTIGGATLSNIAALRETRDRPRFSAMMMDDAGIPQAKQEGLVEKLDPEKIPNLAKVYKRFLFNDGYGVAVNISTAGMFINPQSAATKGLNSYAQIFGDRKFTKRILLNTPNNTPSVLMLIVAAALTTGKSLKDSQYILDEGWDRLAELKPNILTIYENESMGMMVPQGQADIGGIDYSKAIYPHAVAGVPIDMAPLKEGFFTGINSITLAKNAPDPELGNAFINRMLEPSVIQMLSERTLAAPSISGINFKPEVARYMAYPESKMDDIGLVTPDWDFLIPRRAKILERYTALFTS